MVAVPAASPVTTPVNVPTIANIGAELVHVPPGTEFVSVMLVPSQSEEGPEIADGVAPTVMGIVATQPAPVTYEMVAAPDKIPPTRPPDDTVPTADVDEDQVPPAGVAVRLTVLPAQIPVGPPAVIVAVPGMTVTVVVV